MISLFPVFGMLTVIMITPGPNNFLVLNAGLRGGFKATLPVMAGVITGSLGLFGLVLMGITALTSEVPYFTYLLTVIGSGYLVWMGISLMRPATSLETPDRGTALPSSPTAIATFQFVNPKSWVLMSTAIASVGGEVNWLLMFGFVVIMFTCLGIWGFAGAALSSLIKNSKANRNVNLVMGASLVVFAVGLILNQLEIIIKG